MHDSLFNLGLAFGEILYSFWERPSHFVGFLVATATLKLLVWLVLGLDLGFLSLFAGMVLTMVLLNFIDHTRRWHRGYR